VRTAIGAAALSLLAGLIAASTAARAVEPSPAAVTTPVPEPSPAVGRVAYHASKVASFESLGVTMIACRHRDPAPRMISVEFFDPAGNRVTLFGPNTIPSWAPGKKLLFVSDPTYFQKRDIIDMRVGHLSGGTARIVSDARAIHCIAKIRFDAGAGRPSYIRSVGLYRERPGATPAPVDW